MIQFETFSFPSMGCIYLVPFSWLNFQPYVKNSVIITAYEFTCLGVHRTILQVSKLISLVLPVKG